MAMVHSLSQSLASTLDRERIVHTLMDQISSVVRAERTSVFLVDEVDGASRVLLFDPSYGAEPKPRAVAVQDYPIVMQCLSTRKPALQSFLQTDCPSGEKEKEAVDLIAHQMLAVPITFRDETHGAVLFGFGQHHNSMGPRERELCQIVAFALAIAPEKIVGKDRHAGTQQKFEHGLGLRPVVRQIRDR